MTVSRNVLIVLRKLREVDTPFLDESQPLLENEGGVLSPVAANILKNLNAARRARFDLLRPITAQAQFLSKWSPTEDKRLHRLMCYMNSTKNHKQYGWVGDSVENLELHLFCDADLAGDVNDSKSASGGLWVLVGPHTWFPRSALSKKQTAVSLSSVEAELAALVYGMRNEASPTL